MNMKYIECLISVIIPVYNGEEYIEKTLNSVIHQSYKNIEIIIINDFSTDKTEKIVLDFIEKYKNMKIIYYKQNKNMGVAEARNKALTLSKGRFIAFLDSDDIWDKEKLTKQLKLMQIKNTPFSYTAIEMIDPQDKIIKNKRNVKEKITYRGLLYNTMIATSTVIIDRKKIGDFRMPLRRSGQDYATWLSILRKGVIAYGINESLVKYRIRKNSLSSNKLKSIKQVFEIQVKEEKINKLVAAWHTLFFCMNALKKYFI